VQSIKPDFKLKAHQFMLPYKTIIKIDPSCGLALYLQICNEFIKRISGGTIVSGQKLPSSRVLSELLGVNRRTVGTAYEELEAQGWIEIKAYKGSFVNSKLPIYNSKSLPKTNPKTAKSKSHFDILHTDLKSSETPREKRSNIKITIDAGYPDIRLAPIAELNRNLSALSKNRRHQNLMNYSDYFDGDDKLRLAIMDNLKSTRSILVDLENIFISRGSLMAFYLIFKALLNKGDQVIVGDVSFKVANRLVEMNQGSLIRVPVDEQGIDVDAIEKVCQKTSVKAVFVMPHHHNPTTVTLTAKRRMQLLMLAEKHRFAIIEDDYDYDFHFERSPILPMASSDTVGSVIYVGSLSKTIVPGLRTGYIVAPKNLVAAISQISRNMDCHGNHALERAIAILYQDGEIKRYHKKSLIIYHKRRNLFCQLLKEQLGEVVQFEVPKGGLAVWVKFDENYPVEQIKERALELGLRLPKSTFKNINGKKINAIRMGFASLEEVEMRVAVGLLKEAVDEVYENV